MARNNYLNILSLNVGMSNSLAGLPALLSVENLDILLLQEIRMTSFEIEAQLHGFCAVVNVDHSNPSSPGTAIVWRSHLPLVNVSSRVPCRLQTATIDSYMIMNIYAPSGSNRKKEREEFFRQDVFDAIQLDPDKPLICGGDYNAIIAPIDVENAVGYRNKRSQALGDIVRVFNLSDVFRISYPKDKVYTFFRPNCASSRLDRIYLCSKLVDSIVDVKHLPSLSDHFGVKLCLRLNLQAPHVKKQQKASSYWKLNTAILQDEDFLPAFKYLWKDITESISSFQDIGDWWDEVAKPIIKKFCISYSINRKRKRVEKKKYLLCMMRLALEHKNWDEVADIREQLHQLLKEDAMGFVVRSRFGQNAEEERASLFHAGRELKNNKNNLFTIKRQGVQ